MPAKLWTTVAEGIVRYEPSGTLFSHFRSDGKPPKRKSLKTKDLATAKRLLAQRRLEAEKPKLPTIGLKEALERYEGTITRLSDSTQGRAKHFCKKMLDAFGDVPIADLRSSDIQRFLNLRIEGGGAKSSYNEDLRVARGIFAEAVKDKFLDHSPVADLKEMKRDKPLRDTPSQEEFEAILETVGSQKDNRDAQDSVDFLKFMGLAGVGNSEAAALKWKHVNFELEEIRLYRSKTDIGFVITIYQAVRPLLDQLWERSDQKPESNVFRIKSARKALTNACKRLQLPHYTQRSLRRMFITKCIYLNIPPPTIGAWQGHSDNGQTILRYYGQLIARLNSDLAKRIT